MKKTLLSIIFLLILLFVPTMVFAAEGDVAQVGNETFATFEEALEAAKANGEDLVILETLEVGNNSTINIDGVNITGEVNPLFIVNDGFLTIEGNGTISAPNGDAFSLLGNTGSDWETNAIQAGLTIGSNVSVTAKDNCIYLKGNGATANVYGSLTTTETGYATIQGNGNVESGLTVVNIYEGANVLNNGDVAIYNPQAGDVNVYGGTIKGTTGIEMRAGNLLVKGGTIIGTGVPLEVTPNGNGSTSFGAGIAVAQHTTKLNTTAYINGGTIQGYSAVYESNPEKNDAESIAKVYLEINGGKFETKNGGTLSVYSENKTQFITGGTFSTDVSSFVPAYYVCNPSGDNYVVQKLHEITIKVKDSVGGTASSDVIRAVEGRNIGLYITPDKDYELKEIIITDALGVQTKTTNHYFTMPNSDVTVEVIYSKKIVKQEVQIPDAVEDAEKVEDVLLESLKQDSSFKEVVENNNVKVDVQVSEDKVNTAEKEEIEEKLEKEGLTAGKYFDITIAVINKDTGATEGTLDVLTEKIKFTIEIPEDLPEVAEGFVRKYYIIRNHIGQVEYLQTELSADGKSLSFETNKFSTYTLAYADVKTTNDDVVEEDGSEEVPGGTIEEPKEESKEESNPEDMNIPNTGDNIVLYVVLAVMAIVGIIAIKKVNTKKNKH